MYLDCRYLVMFLRSYKSKWRNLFFFLTFSLSVDHCERTCKSRVQKFLDLPATVLVVKTES